MTPPARSICVFCGSSDHVGMEYLTAARMLGEGIAARGWGLVYGGGAQGLMGELARAALQSGGYVTGVIPQDLMRRESILHDVQELVVTPTIEKRKHRMAERACAFVALPGGPGTIDEITEAIARRILGLHTKPCILLNINGFWAPLVSLMDHAIGQGFAAAECREHYYIAGSVAETLDILSRFCLG